jgi:myosin heavy subunit
MANASDELFFETINKSFDGITDLELKSFFVKAHPKDRKGMFTIKHFAGKVSYHIGAKGTNTWLLKNNDDVPQDLTTMLQGSNDEMVRNYVLTLQAQAPQAPSGGRRSSLRKQSIADGFVLSMASLVKTLNESTCSFIRCIKPNAELRPMTFNNLYSLEQVRALGLVQVCAVMKIGLPTRISFPELKEALGPVAKEVEQLFEGHPEETLIASLLYAFNIPQDVYQLGRTKLFFKSGQLDALDRILSTDFEAQKDDIMNRLQAALTARRDCEAAVVTINSSYKELQTFYETTQQSVTDLSTSLMEVREKVVKAFTKDYQSISNSTEKVLNILNTLTCDITDVTTYGQDVESHEDYAPIKKQIGEVQERLNLSELQWKVLDERLLEIEAFCTDPNDAMYELCAERSDELPRIESEVADAHELVHLVELEANRCDVAKVQQKSEDAEHEMSLIRFHLKKLQSGVVDIEKMRGQTISTVEYLKLHMQDVKKFVLESGSLGSSITGSCQEIRRAIDELRAKVAKDLEEKRRMEEEARRREEEEKRKREEEERAILAELVSLLSFSYLCSSPTLPACLP